MQKYSIHIPLSTLIRVSLFLLALFVLYQLTPLLMLCCLAAIVAIALEPVLRQLERIMPRAMALPLLLVTVCGAVAGIVLTLGPPLLEQLGRVAARAPHAGGAILRHIPPGNSLHRWLEGLLSRPMPELEVWMPSVLSFGQLAMHGLTSLALVGALMCYFLVDGKRAYDWFEAFFSDITRLKMRRTAIEITPVVSAYVLGQMIASLCCSIFVFGMLTVLEVPAALTLSVVAGLFDIIPIVGLFLSILPVVFALTVSPQTAAVVFVAYVAYHMFEVYVLVPLIYGKRLKVSGLVVLFGLLAGATLGGIPGAIIMLPLTASYPIIERIWLAKLVGTRAIREHERPEREMGTLQEGMVEV